MISPGGSRWTNRIRTWPKKPVFKNGLVFLSPDRRKRDIGAAVSRTDDSDLAKNAEYHATKQVQEQNETRIAELEDKLARAEVIDISKLSGDTVKFGATGSLAI